MGRIPTPILILEDNYTFEKVHHLYIGIDWTMVFTLGLFFLVCVGYDKSYIFDWFNELNAFCYFEDYPIWIF